MGIKDSIMSNFGNRQPANNDPSIVLYVVTGMQYFRFRNHDNTVVMRQRPDGYVYFDNKNGVYSILEYSWDGPAYKDVTTGQSNTQSRSKGQSKRKGGIGGAILGTVLAPGVGTAIGYLATSKKQYSESTNSDTRMREERNQVEVPSVARIVFQNVETGATATIGIKCNSNYDIAISNFVRPFMVAAEQQAEEQAAMAQSVQQQKSNVELLKEYKELLDLGIISQGDFESKKKQLLDL